MTGWRCGGGGGRGGTWRLGSVSRGERRNRGPSASELRWGHEERAGGSFGCGLCVQAAALVAPARRRRVQSEARVQERNGGWRRSSGRLSRPRRAQSPSAPIGQRGRRLPRGIGVERALGAAARNVAIISIHGEIDRFTPTSVQQQHRGGGACGADALGVPRSIRRGRHVRDARDGVGDQGQRHGTRWRRCGPTRTRRGRSLRSPRAGDGGDGRAATIGDAMPIQVRPVFGLNALPDAGAEKDSDRCR